MNNEPVAWMNRLGRLEYEQGNGFEIPLYTHPAKTLTDEEITQCLNESMDIKGVWGQPMMELNPVNFARAILRKAQDGH
jgi:hypothetical protein